MSSLFNNELPGSSIQVIDEFDQTVYDTSAFGTTESMLIIGTAFDGPSEKEVAIYHPDQAAYIFGNTYDNKTRRSASLTSGIQEAYQAGCRTLYAMRIGGKEISKVYHLRENIPVFLKVSGLFPSNKYKEMSFVYADGKFTIYKTAEKATIEEKRLGVIESSNSIISFTLDLNNAYSINRNSRLVDMIEFVNGHAKNNVFVLSLVDEMGVDITRTDIGQNVSVGSLFEGAYTIGRINKTGSSPVTALTASTTKDYATVSSPVILNLTENTDFEVPYPYVSKNYDFLKNFAALDTVSAKNAIDYEEVDLSSFDLYKKLGSGFAQTAMIEKKGDHTYRVKPTPSDDPNYTVEIAEGLYSIAANLKTDSRVFVAGYADTKITGKRPTVEDFTQISYQKIPVAYCTASGEKPAAHAIYKLSDKSIKTFKFEVKIGSVPVLTTAELAGALEGEVISIDAIASIAEGKKAVVDFEGILWIASATGIIMPVDMLDKENEFIVNVSKEEGKINFTLQLTTEYAEFTTIGDFIDELKLTVLARLFSFEYDNIQANELVIAHMGTPTANKELKPDVSLYIPYTTKDNFARQLAQHVTYTSLKTYQTHGGIGVSPIIDASIRAVTEKANKLTDIDFELYVKNTQGRLVLDQDNAPYHIGKDITVTAYQHTITTKDGYSYVSAGAPSYFAVASKLENDVSTTNQIIAVTPHFEYSETQKIALNKRGYVTVEYKDDAYHITDGITQAPTYSQFSRYATICTVKLVNGVIRRATEPYIGKKNSAVNRNSLYTAIKSGLDKLLDTHLEKYEFKLLYNKTSARLGRIDIDYSIDITDEIRNVQNRVTAKSEV